MPAAPTSPRQFPLLGPGTLLPFTIYKVLPSALTETLLGYQPVGINPMTCPAPEDSSAIKATAFVPPSVTYSVCSSGDNARLLGFAPFGKLPFPRNAGGAVTLNSARTRSFSVEITA